MPPRLRVFAGTSPSYLTDITHLINTGQPHAFVSDRFEGEVVAYIKGLGRGASGASEQDGWGENENEYFEREERRGITWSIQVRGRFLHPISADDVLFGNTFDRPLNLPWGSGAALRFMNYIDPTLEHDLTSSTKPWALSPLISTMPHFAHTRLPESTTTDSTDSDSDTNDVQKNAPLVLPPAARMTAADDLPPFPPRESIADDTSQLHLALADSVVDLSSGGSGSDASSSASSLSSSSSSSSSLSSSSLSLSSMSETRTGTGGGGKMKMRRNESYGGNGKARLKEKRLALANAAARRAYFSTAAHRQGVTFGPQDVITTDFCYGFLEFAPTLSLRLPGGITFDLMRYWDGQPVRFVCCERKREEEEEEEGGGEEPWGPVFWCVAIEMADDDDEESEEGEGEGT